MPRGNPCFEAISSDFKEGISFLATSANNGICVNIAFTPEIVTHLDLAWSIALTKFRQFVHSVHQGSGEKMLGLRRSTLGLLCVLMLPHVCL